MTTNRTHTADETAILKVLENVCAAWDTYDADAFVADYTKDASVILPLAREMAARIPSESRRPLCGRYRRSASFARRP
ncbi:hypothetical protein [Streptomyces sp. NPDC006640]|uniref:hypothetical protein n=1 Tax=unclassified Streptomyces TaxID=2593676 RepID=UPI00369AF8CC